MEQRLTKFQLSQKTQLLFSFFAVLAGLTFLIPPPARADLTTAKETVDKGMAILTGIADTGVSIVIVPFSISFALKIAGHILSHA